MNFKTTLLLVALLAVVGGYWLAFEQGRAPEPAGDTADTEQTGDPLFANAPQADAINQIVLTRDGQSITLQREGDQWWQTKPVRFPLNNSNIQSLIGDATGLRYAQRFAAGSSEAPALDSARLDPPRAKLRLSGDDQSLTLKLGDQYVAGSAYAMTEAGDTVYVVNPTVHETVFDNTVADWRKTSISAPKASAAKRVTLQQADQTIELTKRDGDWYLGPRQRASSEAVSSLADAVRNASIQQFETDQPDDLSLYGLDAPQLTVTVDNAGNDAAATQPTGAQSEQTETAENDTTNQTSATLKVGQPTDLSEENYFAMWRQNQAGQGVIFTISQSTLDELRKTPDDLRDPRIVNVAKKEVQRLQIDRPNHQAIDVQRDPEAGFVFGQPDPGFGVDYEATMDLIEQITTAEAEDYQADFDSTGEALATLKLTHRGSGNVERVRLFTEGNGQSTQPSEYLAVRNDEPVAYRIQTSAIEGVFKPILALRKKTILDLDAAQLAQITLRRDDGVTYTFYPEQAKTQDTDDEAARRWRLEAQQTFEREAFNNLLDAIQPLRIERWAFDSVNLPDKPMQLTLRWQDGQTRTLRVDGQSGQAQLSGLTPAFTLPEALLQKLKAEYRDRTVLPIKSEAIQQVTVIDPDASEDEEAAAIEMTASQLRTALEKATGDNTAPQGMRLTRDENGQYVSPNAEESINQSAAGNLFDRLGGLEVKRYTTRSAMQPIARRIQATTQAGETFELVLLKESNRTWLHGQVNGRSVDQWFTLEDAVRQELMASITGQSSEPSGPAMPGSGGGPAMRPGAGGPGAGGPGGRQIPPAMRRQLQRRMQQQQAQ
jgi:hypothetical protein